MQQYLEFISNHWVLVTIFLVLLVIFLGNEFAHSLKGMKQLSPGQLTQILNHHEGTVFDIRAVDLFHKGHIMGSIKISTDELNKSSRQLEKYKSKPVIIVDANGQQVTKFATELQKQGFEKVSLLKGGIAAWRAANLPLTREKSK